MFATQVCVLLGATVSVIGMALMVVGVMIDRRAQFWSLCGRLRPRGDRLRSSRNGLDDASMSRGDHPAGRADVPDTLVRPDEVKAFMGRYVGMTIREAFAMAAMQGLLSGKTLKELRIQTPDDDQRVLAPMVIATVAAAYADALLVELEKERL